MFSFSKEVDTGCRKAMWTFIRMHRQGLAASIHGGRLRAGVLYGNKVTVVGAARKHAGIDRAYGSMMLAYWQLPAVQACINEFCQAENGRCTIRLLHQEPLLLVLSCSCGPFVLPSPLGLPKLVSVGCKPQVKDEELVERSRLLCRFDRACEEICRALWRAICASPELLDEFTARTPGGLEAHSAFIKYLRSKPLRLKTKRRPGGGHA